MVDAIAGVGTDTTYTAPNQQTNAPVSAKQTTQATQAANTDTTALSETAQILLLQQQGLTYTEIAFQLGITASQVQADLGVQATNTLAAAA